MRSALGTRYTFSRKLIQVPLGRININIANLKLLSPTRVNTHLYVRTFTCTSTAHTFTRNTRHSTLFMFINTIGIIRNDHGDTGTTFLLVFESRCSRLSLLKTPLICTVHLDESVSPHAVATHKNWSWSRLLPVDWS